MTGPMRPIPYMVVSLLLATTLLSCLTIIPVRGDTSTVTVAQNAITMSLHLQLMENITSFVNMGLPKISTRLDQSNSTIYPQIAKMITDAIQDKVPGATASLTMNAKTSLINNATQLWILQENYTLIVTGASAKTGSVVSASLSFLSMNMSQPVRIGGVELNTVGQTYILAPLNAFPTSLSSGIGFFINGAQFRNAVVPGTTTATFRILDFSWVPPISQWNRQDDLLGQSTTFNLNPATSTVFQLGSPYNLSVYTVARENVFLRPYVAVFDPSIQVSVPANAWAQGTTVYYDLPTPSEVVMPVIALASLLVAVGAFMVDRKLVRPGTMRRKKR